MKTIKIACTGAGVLPLDELIEFQGELKSLSKENYERLKNEILNTGFAFPFDIWLSDRNYVIDGHQRKDTLKRMRDVEGYIIPPLPVSFTYADSYEQAKRRVLQRTSQYGKVERQGLYEFMTDASLSIDDLGASFDIPEFSVDIKTFGDEYFNSQVEEEEEEIASSQPSSNHVQCPNCMEHFIPKRAKKSA